MVKRLSFGKEHEWFIKHSDELSKKYPGKYLALIGEIIAAIGATASEAFRLAKKVHPNKKVSLAYIPRAEETITLV